ncbi:GIY-YIG nuclease family protein [Numidum massiliense]|uniref:GIY-YIG nuclease family protein n=1 Tax=Numidum massiliense TaxID=1522315 RepID=UPI00093EE5FC|nr:GIY-YIG nuclease family protein [Numidum massiliense]
MTHAKGHFVYIVECSDHTLYTGYTVDIAQRLAAHNAGKAAKYTRGRTPVTLRYCEAGESRSWGLRRERQIKRMSREEKLALVRQGNECETTRKESDGRAAAEVVCPVRK